MRRRALIAATSLAALGQVVKEMGEVVELALPRFGEESLPSRLTMSHVQAVEAVTERLRGVNRQYGGQADLFSAGDAYGIANAAWHAAKTQLRIEHPGGALKVLQLGQCTLEGFQPGKSTPATLRTDDPRVPTLTARLNRDSATAYALMNNTRQAQCYLAKAHEGWAPRDEFERAGMDLTTAWIQMDLQQLDNAQQLAASALRTYGDAHGRNRTMAALTLAELYVRSGEPRGLGLARSAIDAVMQLCSVRARDRLVPLATALAARPGADAKELARTARQVATIRA